MKLKELLDKDTDKAWESLIRRFEENKEVQPLRQIEGSSRTDTPRISYSKRMLWASGVAAMVVGVVFLYMFQSKQPDVTDTLVLHNGLGEPTLVTTLEDGSTVFLSEETVIEYPTHFSSNKREVNLNGDAFFEIARNEKSPFIINAGNVLIEVLGTSFSVNSKDENTFSLSVRSGEVRVSSKISGESSHVKAGETALIHLDKLQTVPTANVDKFQAYFNRIYFKDQQLGNVLRIMNERNNDSIQINCQPELAARKVNVNLSDESPHDIAEIICAGLNLKYHQKENAIYISTQTD